jgi:hypothetical protein
MNCSFFLTTVQGAAEGADQFRFKEEMLTDVPRSSYRGSAWVILTLFMKRGTTGTILISTDGCLMGSLRRTLGGCELSGAESIVVRSDGWCDLEID